MRTNRIVAGRTFACMLAQSGHLYLANILSLVVLGCGPSPDDPLPRKDDLYLYSLAVAEKARLRVPAQKALSVFNFGQVHERFGSDDEALKCYWKAIDEDADFGRAYRRIGFLLSQRRDQMAEAIDAYKKALRCEPDSPGVYTRLGLIFLHQDRPEKAVRALNEELRGKTATANTYYHLGQAYSKQRKRAEAVEAFRRALEAEPDMRSAHYALAQELRILGDSSGAKKALVEFQELKAAQDAAAARETPEKDDQAHGRRSAAQTWLDAADLYLLAANTPPRDTSPQEKQKAEERRGRYVKETVAALEEAVQLSDNLAEAWSRYVFLLRDQNRLEAALNVSNRARKALPEDGTWPYRSGLLHVELAQKGDEPVKRCEEAVALFEEAAQKAPDFAKAHFQLARTVLFNLARKTQKHLRSAVEHGERAVELDPDPAHYDVLAYAYATIKRLDLARKTLEDGLRNNPDAKSLKHRLQLLTQKLEGLR